MQMVPVRMFLGIMFIALYSSSMALIVMTTTLRECEVVCYRPASIMDEFARQAYPELGFNEAKGDL